MQTLEVTCSDDAEVNESYPDTNYGTVDKISVGRGIAWNLSYFAFDISNKPNAFVNAEFAVNLWYTEAPDQDYDIEVMEVNGEIWSETNITWNNQPDLFSFITSLKVEQNYISKTYFVNITSLLSYDYPHNFFSIALEATGENGTCYCLTKEFSPTNSSDAPRIIWYYIEEPTGQPVISFGNFYIIGLLITLGIAIQLVRMRNSHKGFYTN